MDETKLKIAEHLLQIKAINIQISNPFLWASGWRSPIYNDNRVILSYPEIRNFVKNELVRYIRENSLNPDIIAGVATGGIPLGVLVAQEFELPFIYVRSSPKDHGLGKQIEGYFEPNKSVVLVEDLISTGGSSLNVIKCLRDNKLNVIKLIAIFDYKFSVSENAFKSANVECYALTDYYALIECALSKKFLNEEEIKILNQWHNSPEIWQGK